MENYWTTLAETLQEIYGTDVNWAEEYFVCDHCGQRIYKAEWRRKDYFKCRKYRGAWYCPNCGRILWEEGE